MNVDYLSNNFNYNELTFSFIHTNKQLVQLHSYLQEWPLIQVESGIQELGVATDV